MKRNTKLASTFAQPYANTAQSKPIFGWDTCDFIDPRTNFKHNHKVSGLVEAIAYGMGYNANLKSDNFFTAVRNQSGLIYPITATKNPDDVFVIGTETIDNVLKLPPIVNSYISASGLGVTPTELLFYMTSFAKDGKPCLQVGIKKGVVAVTLDALLLTCQTAVFNPQAIKKWVHDNAGDYQMHFAPYKMVAVKGKRIQVPR